MRKIDAGQQPSLPLLHGPPILLLIMAPTQQVQTAVDHQQRQFLFEGPSPFPAAGGHEIRGQDHFTHQPTVFFTLRIQFQGIQPEIVVRRPLSF